LHGLVASGKVGKPRYCKVWDLQTDPDLYAPHYNLATSGGAALAANIHGLDLSIWVGGSPNPVSVSASMGRLFPEKRGALASEAIMKRYDIEDDFMAALIRFDNGAVYLLEDNWCSDRSKETAFELVTSRGTLKSTPFSIVVDEKGKVVDQTPEMTRSNDWNSSILNQDRDVIEKLRIGSPLTMQDHRQLLNIQMLVDGCYESARLGHEIRF
jgi:predicted dehydrogenase